MKVKHTLLILLFTLLCSSTYCDHWETHWLKAVELCETKQFIEAEEQFTQAIKYLEEDQDDDHPHIYVDRARLYCLQDRYHEALVDVSKGLQSEKLIENDRLRGIVTRMHIYSNLDMEKEFLEDHQEFRILNTDAPKIEFTEESVIIRNVPKSNCYRKIAKAFLVNSGICESETDIKEFSSGIIIAKRSDLCDCVCKVRGDPRNRPREADIQGCNWWCDKNAGVAGFWCARVFKTWKCQGSCLFAVDLLKDGCYWCCRNGNFYETCLEPFGDIVGKMGEGCDPAWD